MNIHQLNVSYVNEQDRFLLRINSLGGEEFRAWFTRRLTLNLLPLLKRTASEQLQTQIAPPDVHAPLPVQRDQLLESFQKEAAIYSGDFQTPFKEDAAVLPLGADPLLVTELKITPLADGKLQVELLEKLQGQLRDLRLVMDPALTQGLLRLLTQGLKASSWLDTPPPVLALDAADATALTPVEADAAETADASLASKPKYLN